MRAACRWVLVLLLVLGVPMKALAGSGWLGCAPAGHAQAADAHGPHDGHVAHAAQHADAGAPTVGDAADAGASDNAGEGPSHGQCSACAPCCAAAAPAPEGPRLAAAPAGAARPGPLPADPHGIVTDVPHRPPR